MRNNFVIFKSKNQTQKYLHYILSRNAIIARQDTDNGKIIEEGIANRDTLYTDLLENYVQLTDKRNRHKEFHKWVFFWIIMGLGVSVCICLMIFIYNIIMKPKINYESEILALITAFISLISTVVSIPLIVTKYLFNIKEDDNITQVITKTQEHDNIEMELFAERFSVKNTKRKEKTFRQKSNSPICKQGDINKEHKEISNLKTELNGLNETL